MPTDPPKLLSSEFSGWENWRALASAVNQDAARAIADPAVTDLPILAEMLLAAGSRELMVELLQAGPSTLHVMTLADDFAARIDRMCDSHLWHKAEAPLLAGQPLFKFETARN